MRESPVRPQTTNPLCLDESFFSWEHDRLGRFLKYSFNADSAYIGGISNMALGALELYYQTDEALEGVNVFMERRGRFLEVS